MKPNLDLLPKFSFRDTFEMMEHNRRSKPVIAIGKPLNRQRGDSKQDPDYIVKAKRWDVWVYPDITSERNDPWDSRRSGYMDKEHRKPLLDLLGSNGCETMAMLYIEYIHGPKPHYNLNNFIDLNTEYRIKYLVHFMLYEPHKINWVDIMVSSPGYREK